MLIIIIVDSNDRPHSLSAVSTIRLLLVRSAGPRAVVSVHAGADAAAQIEVAHLDHASYKRLRILRLRLHALNSGWTLIAKARWIWLLFGMR